MRFVMAIKRRDFLKIAGLGIAAGVVAPRLSQAANVIREASAETPMYPPLEFDVAVVGAGPGGIPAAIAAAREGAKVVLIEEDMAPGGAPVDMFVPFVCGAPRLGVFSEMMKSMISPESPIRISTTVTMGKTTGGIPPRSNRLPLS